MLEERYNISIKAALEAGKAILEVYKEDIVEVNYKNDNSPLTVADSRSSEIIVKCLDQTGIPIISEEIEDKPFFERKNWNLFWLVDPLDGTKEFIKKNGEFTVNIALVKNGEPIWGVIYVPDKQILYYGGEEEGSYKVEKIRNFEEFNHREENKLLVEKNDDTRKITVVASKSHLSKETLEYVNQLKEVYSEVDFLSAGSSLKFCMVAEGKANVYPRFAPTMEWDTGAGHAICRAMGIPVKNVNTNHELIYNKENLLNPYFVVNDLIIKTTVL